MSVNNLALGFGYRSIRNADRKLSFQVGGGVAQENAKIKPEIPGLDDQSDSRQAAFVRVAAEGFNATFWVQYGIGFEDETEPSPIVWSDSVVFGVLWSFH